jgi:hypothetical protein
VVDVAVEVGRRLGLPADRMRNLEFGALLHDVGKVAIPKEIINKPGPLDDDEWEVIRQHTIEGQRMLDRVGGFMRDVGVIVRSHHERWDGGGYPDRLARGRGAARRRVGRRKCVRPQSQPAAAISVRSCSPALLLIVPGATPVTRLKARLNAASDR